MGTRSRRVDSRRGARARAAEIVAITTPLLIVVTSLDEGPDIERCFGSGPDSTMLGVFARSEANGRVVDLRGEAPPDLSSAKRAPGVSLDRDPGDRRHTEEIAEAIADAIAGIGAASVAVGLGLLGGDDLEASDAAFVARRRTSQRLEWLCYSLDGADVVRVARRRAALFARGIRLDPITISAPDDDARARFWKIRAPHHY